VRPELIKGRGGVFEVVVGNDLVFSKKQERRFPQPGEVEEALAGRLESAGP
jgi:selT/selW/selH-like putative selenoprotein